MLKGKKKFTKKELKEDKFVTMTLQAREYMEENSKKIMQIGLAIIVVFALFWFYSNSKKTANVEANALLGEAQFAYNMGDKDRGENTLKKLVDDFKGVSAAGQGCFLLAKKYWEISDYTNAEAYFKQYLDDYSGDDLLTASAYAGYGDCMQEKGDIAKAADYYERAGKVNRDLPSTPSFIYSAALTYMELDQVDKARELAEDILKNFEKSEYKKKAEVLLDMLKVKA